MSGREWKPGDVALVTGPAPFVDQGQDYSVNSTEVACSFTVDGLWKPLDRRDYGFQAHEARTARPLVVIDPEDREQVERLRRALFDAGAFESVIFPNQVQRVDRVGAALREFANPKPPKPDEPTTMWSVVVDAAGDQWVRVLGPDFTDAWVRAGDLPSKGKWTDYRGIDAVEVVR